METNNLTVARGIRRVYHDAFPALLGKNHGFGLWPQCSQLFQPTPSPLERLRTHDSVRRKRFLETSVKTRTSNTNSVHKERRADNDLGGCLFIATGGAQGLGLSMAEALAEAGGEAETSKNTTYSGYNWECTTADHVLLVYCLDRAPTPDEAWVESQSRLVTGSGLTALQVARCHRHSAS